MKPRRILVGSLALLFALALYPAGVTAHHRWGKYHWARSVNPLLLDIAGNVDSTWNNLLGFAVGDWNQSIVLSLTNVNGGGADPVECAPTAGRVNVCNAHYGDNGWLGLAQIWITSGSHITQGTTKLNDTYFDTPQYDSAAWRRLVVCQEVGHTFGLDHQDERFTNANLGTCMDYTDDPDGSLHNQLSNLSPNTHDYEELETIYSHLDGYERWRRRRTRPARRRGRRPGAAAASVRPGPG